MTDALNSVRPGQPITDKVALAKSNAEETATAQRLAAEHRARDLAASGHEKPLLQSLGDSIKDKLEHKEFHGTPTPEQEEAARHNP